VTKIEGAEFSVEIRAYATRVLFYLIADPSVRNVLNGLTTLAGAVTPRASPPTQLDLFATSSQNGSAAPFTLEGVMRSAEHTGCAEDPQPSRIALPMKPYQLQAIRWMRQMEGLNLNSLFWEKRAFGDGGEYWFAPDLGECRPVWKSTSASGAPDNSSLSHFSAMARPCWFRRVVGNRHRHAIEQASRRRRGGRRDDSARTRRKILISTQVPPRGAADRVGWTVM
jgi:hypothetical protein